MFDARVDRMKAAEGRKKSSVEVAAARLRMLALQVECGTLIGTEEAMTELLGFSRPTVRQAARMLEREGLIRVRRGSGGGYLAARPDIETIEQTVSAYMESRAVAAQEMTAVAAALWVEVVEQAAGVPIDARASVVSALRDRVAAVSDTAPISQAVALDEMVRNAILALVEVPYIQMIFHITETFARRRMVLVGEYAADDPTFVPTWRAAKMLELDAILLGDAEIAAVAARRVRALLRRFVLSAMPG